MVKWPIYLATAVVFFLVAVLARAAYRVRREASKKREDVKWMLGQLERALVEIESDDGDKILEDKILSGLQTLTYVNDPTARLRAFPRVADLCQSSNPLVARQARVTMEKLSKFARR